MTENRASVIFDELKDVKDSFDRAYILSFLYSRIAAGVESSEVDPKDLNAQSDSEFWGAAGSYFEALAELNTDRALQVAVDLVFFPVSGDDKQEKVNAWIRTNGLSALGLPKIAEKLPGYLETGAMGAQLADRLEGYIAADVSDLREVDDFANPKGFNAAQSGYIALGLVGPEGSAAKKLHNIAEARKNAPDFIHAASVVKTFPGCEYLGERL